MGSHVRDAAAYVCWAFGRAYSYIDMKAVLEQLSPHLLTVACYDREVLNNFLAKEDNHIHISFSARHINFFKALSTMLRLIAEEQLQLLSRKMLGGKEISLMASI